jgi:lipopolysaccharide export system protein LptC
VVSREPVTVTMPNGNVEAQSLEITDNGKMLSFIGRVRTIIQPEADPSMTSSVAEAPASLPARTVASQPQPTSLRP